MKSKSPCLAPDRAVSSLILSRPRSHCTLSTVYFFRNPTGLPTNSTFRPFIPSPRFEFWLVYQGGGAKKPNTERNVFATSLEHDRRMIQIRQFNLADRQ